MGVLAQPLSGTEDVPAAHFAHAPWQLVHASPFRIVPFSQGATAANAQTQSALNSAANELCEQAASLSLAGRQALEHPACHFLMHSGAHARMRTHTRATCTNTSPFPTSNH